MNDPYNVIMRTLKSYVENMNGIQKAADSLGISYQTLAQWLNGKRTPNLKSMGPLLDKLGLEVVSKKPEASKDVCFVDAKIVNSSSTTPPPVPIDYTAAPVVGEVGAGPGYLSEDKIESWFLVYSRLPAVRYRKNLIAVKIGRNSTSMQPALNPEDIVLVDRDDRDVTRPGRMMLVLDPVDQSGMVKRVSVQELKNDFQITYYSDNAAKYPPLVYSLNRDFDGDWDRAIVGRVIWAWQDMREK